MWLDLFSASILERTCVRCGRPGFAPTCSGCGTSAPSRWTTPGGLPVIALGLYDGPPGQQVRRLKYDDETVWAARLGWAMGALIPQAWRNHTLVPVPLHPTRLADRGFNQSALLARAAGGRTGNSVRTDLIRRHRETTAQARLGRGERANNLRDALVGQPTKTRLRLVLVDDVATTGHTLDACALALREAGFTVDGALCCALARASAA